MARHSLWHALEGFYPNRIRVIPKRQRFPSQRPRRYPDMEIATRRELTMARVPPATDALSAPRPQAVPKCPNTTSQPGQTEQPEGSAAGAPPTPVIPLQPNRCPISQLLLQWPPTALYKLLAAGCWLCGLCPRTRGRQSGPLTSRQGPREETLIQKPAGIPATQASRSPLHQYDKDNSIWPRSDQADPVHLPRNRPPGPSRKDAMAAPTAACFPSPPHPRNAKPN